MKTFNDYLESKNYRPRTVERYLREHATVIDWLTEFRLKESSVTYPDVLQLIRIQKARSRNRAMINHLLRAARLYFDYLTETQRVTDNPFVGVHIKGATRRLPHDLYEWEVLESFYTDYSITDAISHRNKVILGILIYQAVTMGELERLACSDLLLSEGKLRVAGSPNSNGRTLALDASQIILLQEYQNDIREQLLKTIRHKRKRKAITDQLFFGSEGGSVHARLWTFLKRLDPGLTTMKIRESVITYWLKTKDIRIVQYMAGHKYVSSTERYKEASMEELQEALEKYHPLNQMKL